MPVAGASVPGPAERQMSAVAGNHGDLPIITKHLAGLEQVDDGLDGSSARRLETSYRPESTFSLRRASGARSGPQILDSDFGGTQI